MRSTAGDAVEQIAALVDDFHITDRALMRSRERLRSTRDHDARDAFLRHVRRYFGAVVREAESHIAHVDRTLDELYQRQYNAQAERSVAARRLERARAVLTASADDSSRTGP